MLVAAPAIAVFVYVHQFGVDVPYFDEWDEMRHVLAFYEGNPGLKDLIATHNEHHLVFPRLFMLVLARVTNYNLRAFMFVNVMLLCATVVLLLMVHLRVQRARNRTVLFALLTFVPVSCLMLTFRQVDNLLFGIQIIVFFSFLFFVLAMMLLDSSQGLDARFFAAIAAAVVAAFSFSIGLVAFPIGFIQLLLRRRSKPEMVIWGFGGVAVLIVYAVSFFGATLAAHPSFALRHPVTALLQLIAFVGNPFSTDIYPALAVGTIVFALYLAVAGLLIREGRWQTSRYTSVMFSLVLFTVFCGVMIIFGRAQFGAQGGLAPRYVSLAVPGVCGLYMILLTLEASRWKKVLLGVSIGLIAQGILTSYPQGFLAARFWNAQRSANAHYLRTYRQQPDEHLATLFPQVDKVRERAATLEKHKLSVFRDASHVNPQAAASQTRFEIETIDGEKVDGKAPVTVDGAKEVVINGWATDSPRGKTATGVFVVLDGARDVAAKYGLARSATAGLSGYDRYFYSGFSARIPPSTLMPGTHQLGLRIVSADGRFYYSTPAITLSVE